MVRDRVAVPAATLGPFRNSAGAQATTVSKYRHDASSRLVCRSASSGARGASSHGPVTSGAPKSVVALPVTFPTTLTSPGVNPGPATST
ncbi:MAG TPA: hypothetical protein VGS19_08710 [Streptosporangiaceae bacterium]|nr:hypothetical protein [Streptosporangiaceae bacterium]